MKSLYRQIVRNSRILLQSKIVNKGNATSLIKTESSGLCQCRAFCIFGSRALNNLNIAMEKQEEIPNMMQIDRIQTNDQDDLLNSKKCDILHDKIEEAEASKTDSKRKNVRKRKPKRSEEQKNLHMTYKRQKVTNEDSMTETKYYFENGLRKVVPYDHKYDTFCKGRWEGKTLREIYTTEFRLHPVEYYEESIKEKRLMINLKPIKSLEHVLKSNDLLTSVVHRHECPVIDSKFEIVHEDYEWFVINKPCSIPLHPAGRFRYNSIISILAKEYNKSGLYGVHRLDRMTSGLLLFAKNAQLAGELHKLIKERKVEKEYVCRVEGDFSKFKLPPKTDHRIKVEGKKVTISEPIKIFDMKVGTSIVSRDRTAKDAVTVFECLHTDGKTSVLSCKPRTGRTHQIRVHLQYLGFPISNDQIYNSPAWGDERFKLGSITKPLEDVSLELSERKKWLSIMSSVYKTMAEQDGSSKRDSSTQDTSDAEMRLKFEEEGFVPYRPECEECKYPLPDPEAKDLVMYLHALKYEGPDWSFETEMPEWASPDWGKEKKKK